MAFILSSVCVFSHTYIWRLFFNAEAHKEELTVHSCQVPLAKGGFRGICLRLSEENAPWPPFVKGGMFCQRFVLIKNNLFLTITTGRGVATPPAAFLFDPARKKEAKNGFFMEGAWAGGSLIQRCLMTAVPLRGSPSYGAVRL